MKHGFIFVFLFFIASSCKNKVITTSPVKENISESIYASGLMKSKNQYQAYASGNGVVTELMVEEGERIKKGQVIMRLENTTAKLNVESAALAAMNASVLNNAEKLIDLQNATRLAKEKMDYDSSLLLRKQKLWEQRIGSRNEVDLLELAYKNSKNTYDAAQLNYVNLQKLLSFQDKQAQKNLNISKSLAANYLVKSDMDGTVYQLLVSKGEMVNMQSPVAILGEENDFILELQVDEYDIAKIKNGQLVLVNMDSYKGAVFEAVVTKINPLMNQRTKSFTIEADFVKRPTILYPNLTCEANIVIRSKEKALTIPRNYLLEGGFVLLENNKKRKVITGLKDYQKVEILQGLTTADIIYKPEE